MKPSCRTLVTGLLVVSLASAGLPAHADMLRTDLSVATERDRIAAVLHRPEVRAQLLARGVDGAQVSARVAALTDKEAALLAAEMDKLPAGGGGLEDIVLLPVLLILLLPVVLVALVVKAIRKAPVTKYEAPEAS